MAVAKKVFPNLKLSEAFDELEVTAAQREALIWVPKKAIDAAAAFSKTVRTTRFFEPSGPIAGTCLLGRTWEAARSLAVAKAEKIGGIDNSIEDNADNAMMAAIQRFDKKSGANSVKEALAIIREAIGEIAYEVSLGAAERIGYDQPGSPTAVKHIIAAGVQNEARIMASLVFLKAMGCEITEVKFPWKPWVALANGDGVLGYVKGDLLRYRMYNRTDIKRRD